MPDAPRSTPFALTLVSALAICSLAACHGDDPWQVRSTESDAWLLAATGLADQVLAVGGQPGPAPTQPGTGRILRVPDDPGAAVERLASPQPGMLWWAHTVSATPGAGLAWLCGEAGSVIRYAERPDAAPELLPIPTMTSVTLYGIWAFGDDEVWAVGGTEGGPGVVLHGGRAGLSPDPTVPQVPILFKVFATDRDHLFIVGHAGTLLRRVGTTWTLDPYPGAMPDRLLTAFGTGPTDVYAVGGLGSGRLLRFDGSGWTADDGAVRLGPLAGLYATADELLITGQRGLIARRPPPLQSGPLVVEPVVTDLDLHGALRRGAARYAVGGNLSEYGLRPPRGVLLQQGSP